MTGTRLKRKWLPPNWAEWPQEGRIAYLSNTHRRADFAVTLGAALGFEPNNGERFTLGELGVIVHARHHASDHAGGITLGNTREKLIEQLAARCGLMIVDESRISETELAAVIVAFEDAGFSVLQATGPSDRGDMVMVADGVD